MYVAGDVEAACLMARGVNQRPYGTKPLYIVELPDGSRMTINDQKNYLYLVKILKLISR